MHQQRPTHMRNAKAQEARNNHLYKSVEQVIEQLQEEITPTRSKSKKKGKEKRDTSDCEEVKEDKTSCIEINPMSPTPDNTSNKVEEEAIASAANTDTTSHTTEDNSKEKKPVNTVSLDKLKRFVEKQNKVPAKRTSARITSNENPEVIDNAQAGPSAKRVSKYKCDKTKLGTFLTYNNQTGCISSTPFKIEGKRGPKGGDTFIFMNDKLVELENQAGIKYRDINEGFKTEEHKQFMHDRLDMFVRMCKYNSFETYPIVHCSEVHMQNTEVTPAVDNVEIQDDVNKSVIEEAKESLENVNDDKTLENDNKIQIDEVKESLGNIEDITSSPLRTSSRTRNASQMVKQTQEASTSKDTESETETMSKKRTSSRRRIASTDDDNTEEFPFFQSPTTSPGKDGSISGIRSIKKEDNVDDIPLADRHACLNKEKTKVIKRRIKKVKNKEGEKAFKNKKGKDKTKSV